MQPTRIPAPHTPRVLVLVDAPRAAGPAGQLLASCPLLAAQHARRRRHRARAAAAADTVAAPQPASHACARQRAASGRHGGAALPAAPHARHARGRRGRRPTPGPRSPPSSPPHPAQRSARSSHAWQGRATAAAARAASAGGGRQMGGRGGRPRGQEHAVITLWAAPGVLCRRSRRAAPGPRGAGPRDQQRPAGITARLRRQQRRRARELRPWLAAAGSRGPLARPSGPGGRWPAGCRRQAQAAGPRARPGAGRACQGARSSWVRGVHPAVVGSPGAGCSGRCCSRV